MISSDVEAWVEELEVVECVSCFGVNCFWVGGVDEKKLELHQPAWAGPQG